MQLRPKKAKKKLPKMFETDRRTEEANKNKREKNPTMLLQSSLIFALLASALSAVVGEVTETLNYYLICYYSQFAPSVDRISHKLIAKQ